MIIGNKSFIQLAFLLGFLTNALLFPCWLGRQCALAVVNSCRRRGCSWFYQAGFLFFCLRKQIALYLCCGLKKRYRNTTLGKKRVSV